MSTSTEPGAGAWVRPRWYSKDTVGRTIDEALGAEDEQRIRYAASSIQRELVVQGFLPKDSACSGMFGPYTEAAIKKFQAKVGLAADGRAGQDTLRRLCCRRDYGVVDWQQQHGRIRIPDNLLAGQIRLESAFDPGAQGVNRTKSTDRGLAQISDVFHPEVTDAQAYGDIRISVRFAARSLREARHYDYPELSYGDQGLWWCAVAHHNNPSKARAWFENAAAPDEQIARYVRLVYEFAARSW